MGFVLRMIGNDMEDCSLDFVNLFRNLPEFVHLTSFTGEGNAFCVFYSPFIKNIFSSVGRNI